MIFPKDLPASTSTEKLMQSMSALDAVLCPNWEYRYFMFNSAWGTGERMGSIKNGVGDEVFMLFNEDGCFMKGLSHEFQAAKFDGGAYYDQVPAVFKNAAQEPAFSPEFVNFCFWYTNATEAWDSVTTGEPLNPNVFLLLSVFDRKPETFAEYSDEYHEIEVSLAIVEQLYRHEPMSEAIAAILNPEIAYSDLTKDLDEISYPYIA